MGLIHAANSTRWRVGDFVIHDSDAKRADMLMVVIGCSRDGIYRTRYAFPGEQPRSWRRKVWRNALVLSAARQRRAEALNRSLADSKRCPHSESPASAHRAKSSSSWPYENSESNCPPASSVR